MITEISVENVALIEEATLELSPGLNAITGETGAGKTLLATALQLLLGGRARSEAVRAGASRATVEGTFYLPDETRSAALSDSLGDLAEEVDAEDGLVLRRTLTEEGRSRCYVGGVSVPVRALGALGEYLVSYHGQREQTRLTEPAEQLAILDDFLDGAAGKAKQERGTLWHALQRDRRELAEVSASGEARLREVDFLRFQISELEAAGYREAEVAELARERDRLRNVTDLLQSAGAATAALADEGGGAGLWPDDPRRSWRRPPASIPASPDLWSGWRPLRRARGRALRAAILPRRARGRPEPPGGGRGPPGRPAGPGAQVRGRRRVPGGRQSSPGPAREPGRGDGGARGSDRGR